MEAIFLQVLPTEAYFAKVRESLAQLGQSYVRVTGMSMWPLLHHLRDGVIIIPPDRIRTGDIVLFDRQNGRYALHRVVGRGKHGFSMAGDHQWHVERNLPYDQIVGVASMLHRKGRLIPSKNFFVRCYALAVTVLTPPRIFLRQVIKFLRKMIQSAGRSPEKGAQ